MMHASEVEKKIQEYEHYIEEKLKKDLKDIEIILKNKTEKYREWEEVKEVAKVVDEFRKNDQDMEVMLDIGSGVQVTGEISDYENTYVEIGLGYLLEMNTKEASKYSDIRLRLIKKEIDHFRKLAVNVKVHIKLVLLAIGELQATLLPDKLERASIK